MRADLSPLIPAPPFIRQYFTEDFNRAQHLTPAEALMVEQASQKRRVDFSAGRYCARQALATITGIEHEVLRGTGNEPLWPAGIVGSISHSQKLAGAVVAKCADVRAIGLDIETIGGVKPDTWYLLFNDAEQHLIQSKPDIALWATLLFCLKESFYKLQYPLTRLFVDFKEIEILEREGKLRLACADSKLNFPFVLSDVEIHWTQTGDQLITLCYLPC